MLKGFVRDAAAALLLLLSLAAASAVVLSPRDYRVGFESLLATWADFVRDVDHIGLSVTRIPADEEMQIGAAMARQLSFEEETGTPRAFYVGVVGANLIRLGGVRRTDISYHFHLLRDSSVINAWAMPGGHIFITTGMLSMITSEAQLASVLAHEISHVDLRHAVERLQYEAAMRRVVGDIAELSGIAYGLVDIAYSTQEESEADRTGFLMMARTGYSPVEAITLFRAMQLALERPSEVTRPAGPLGELSTGLGAALQDYFRTHPSFADRIADLRQLLAENDSSWRSKMFCVGTSNLRDLVTCMDERRDAEWVPVDASQLK